MTMPPILKPTGCNGCPFQNRGRYFVPDEMVEGADVCIMGQNPGKNEEEGFKVTGYGEHDVEPHPPASYIGKTGFEMEKHYFPLAGLERGKVSLCNAIRCRVDGTDKLPPVESKEVRHAIEHCGRAHLRLPSSTRTLVAEGEYALYATTGEGIGQKGRTISSWRGWLLPYNPPPRPTLVHTDIFTPGPGVIKVLATYHIAYLFRAPWERPVSMRDWDKLGRVRRGEWPRQLPVIEKLPPTVWPRVAAFDTEFYEDGRLIRYSLAYRDKVPGGVRVHVVEARDAGPIVKVPPGATVIMQNADADLGHLNNLLGGVKVRVDDTMYAHAVLWPDLDHDLDFGGSLYASINRWKHLVDTNPVVYSAGDALGTLDWHMGMVGEFERDPQSKWIYENSMLPLLGIISKARSKGIRVRRHRVLKAVEELGKRMDDATLMAQAAVGWPINLGSPQQVAQQLYEVEKIHINPMSGRKR